MTPLKAFFITFGQSHPLRSRYVGVIAPDANAALAGAFHTFGEKFCTVYDASDERHGLVHQVLDYGISPAFFFCSVIHPFDDTPETTWASEQDFCSAVNLQRQEAA